MGITDSLNKVPVQESQKRLKEGSLLRGPPYPTYEEQGKFTTLPRPRGL